MNEVSSGKSDNKNESQQVRHTKQLKSYIHDLDGKTEPSPVILVYIVTCRPISRQRPKFEHATIEPGGKKGFLCGPHISIAR
jgi:hypothetical protein